jgi:site-specific recombinase XerD
LLPTTPPHRELSIVTRLGRHHFAHLRAVAEGVDLQLSAQRYLGIEHGHQARTAHRQTVDRARALALRRGDSAWRLIGITISPAAGKTWPTLEDFIHERDLDGWSEAEVVQMYSEAYPADTRVQRRNRLRERQLQLIQHLQHVAAEQPLPSDAVSGWFDALTASKLIAAGMVSLADLNQSVSTGGRWFRAMPAVGPAKAQRIAAHLATLLPRDLAPPKPVFRLTATPALFHESHALAPTPTESRERPAPAFPADARWLIASNDVEAVDAWISARAGSRLTATAYRRDALRLMLWLQYECAWTRLDQMTPEHCRRFMTFLQHLPTGWQSRTRAAPGAPGWAPFRGPLSHASQRQTVTVVASLFSWLQSAQYLHANPWILVNHDTGDDRQRRLLDSKAVSEQAMAELLRVIDLQPPSPGRTRIRFILRFVEAVGLRSAELIAARLGDFSQQDEGWMVQVHGKGAKNRLAAVPAQAVEALTAYLQYRGWDSIDAAPADAPLLASTADTMSPVGYQALYEHVKAWLTKAVRRSSLPESERVPLADASTHWLRHTFGTRAVARGVPIDVIQAQMGHASQQTTTSIYGRAPLQRRLDELGKAFQ